MTFEGKLSQMYNEIANEISGMIPVEWEQVFTIAYVTDQAGEVIFNYTKPDSDELNYYSDIPKDCNVSKDIFKNSWFKVYRMFDELRETFKEEGLEPWTSCEFDFTRDGKLNVSFDYIDWINTEFDQLGRQNYYMYKNLGLYQKWNMKWKKLKKSNNILKSKKKLNNRGDNMTFEEKISKLYNEIANEISSMIPVEWEKVYTMAYIDDGGGEVFFNYTKPGSDDLNYYTDIPKEYNISVQVFDDLWMDLYDLFEELRDLFKEEGLEPWTSCEFDFTSEGKLKVSFDYIDWINTEFDQLGRENYYMYKNLGFYQKWNMKWKKLKKSINILKSKMKLKYRGDNMTFEEKLSQMYNEIANEISGMIPVEWEKVYTIAYVDDEGGEVVFNYTKPGSEDLNYYSDIPKDCNVSKDIFKNSWFKVYRMFDELRETFKKKI